MVTAVAYTNFRKDLKSYLRKVNNDADALLVTNKDPEDDVIVMSTRDYESLLETLHVYQNPYLLDKVLRGLRDARAGHFSHYDIPLDAIENEEDSDAVLDR
ncbi:prevent-host-death protein [Alloscardovia macacae]|uniref:Antitoxin n=1 Tax=Alloscardovia macacae TaxID=1160091 RepID=A0A1Y2SUX6_9BIFI|nr:type II toxin-antitoxin system Phd/YefM family antitoxin [Alloscardovia macacae]OTA25525.1 prevent-host-death protein [Alloscardovia macacae]OTA28092.1 prevent-host-death protein [Alloscardovia macacae]